MKLKIRLELTPHSACTPRSHKEDWRAAQRNSRVGYSPKLIVSTCYRSRNHRTRCTGALRPAAHRWYQVLLYRNIHSEIPDQQFQLEFPHNDTCCTETALQMLEISFWRHICGKPTSSDTTTSWKVACKHRSNSNSIPARDKHYLASKRSQSRSLQLALTRRERLHWCPQSRRAATFFHFNQSFRVAQTSQYRAKSPQPTMKQRDWDFN